MTSLSLPLVSVSSAEILAQAQLQAVEARLDFVTLTREADTRAALRQFDGRRNRWAADLDKTYRNVAWTLASFASGETHQCWPSIATLMQRYREQHGRGINKSTLRNKLYQMANHGLITIEQRQQGPYGEYPGSQQSNLYTVHFGLTISNGRLAEHKFTEALAEGYVTDELDQGGLGVDQGWTTNASKNTSENTPKKCSSSRDDAGRGSGGVAAPAADIKDTLESIQEWWSTGTYAVTPLRLRFIRGTLQRSKLRHEDIVDRINAWIDDQGDRHLSTKANPAAYFCKILPDILSGGWAPPSRDLKE
jgi:hypothetical protein